MEQQVPVPRMKRKAVDLAQCSSRRPDESSHQIGQRVLQRLERVEELQQAFVRHLPTIERTEEEEEGQPEAGKDPCAYEVASQNDSPYMRPIPKSGPPKLPSTHRPAQAAKPHFDPQTRPLPAPPLPPKSPLIARRSAPPLPPKPAQWKTSPQAESGKVIASRKRVSNLSQLAQNTKTFENRLTVRVVQKGQPFLGHTVQHQLHPHRRPSVCLSVRLSVRPPANRVQTQVSR